MTPVKKHIYHYNAKSWVHSSNFLVGDGIYHSHNPIVNVDALNSLRRQIAAVHGTKDPDAVWVIESLSYLGRQTVEELK
jgi:hypothetical protein